MKLLVWTVFAIGLLLWTAATWGVAEITQWVGSVLASGQDVDWPEAMGGLRWPAWLTQWIDPAWIAIALGAVAAGLEALRQVAPWFGSVAGWVVALLWTVWALGALLWLALAGGLHLLVGRVAAPPRPASA